MDLESLQMLKMLIEKDHKIFNEALKKVDKLAQKQPGDPKKWEFVKCRINDVYYDYVKKYDIVQNLENDVKWYGDEAIRDWLKWYSYEELRGWRDWYGYEAVRDRLRAILNAGPDHIVQEAIKDYW